MTAPDLDVDRLRGLEAVLFLADHPLDLPTIARALDCAPQAVEPLLAELDQRLVERQSGLTLRHVGGGWRLYTAIEARDHVERHVLAGRAGRLSQAALETLAVVAYKQPISRTEIGDIRGVNADGPVRSLVQRGLIEEVGRDDGPGQAVLYGTTVEFLERMGLEDLDALPALSEFLPEHPAPDEPGPDQLREARKRLQSGRDLPSTGAARWDPDDEEAADPDTEERAAQAARRLQEVARRRSQEEEMDQLTGALEQAAKSAVTQLRSALAAVESDEDEGSDEDPDDGPRQAAIPDDGESDDDESDDGDSSSESDDGDDHG